VRSTHGVLKTCHFFESFFKSVEVTQRLLNMAHTFCVIELIAILTLLVNHLNAKDVNICPQ